MMNRYFNRELSWLKFNERVLEQASDSSMPILDRLKFISIFSSNLDEFFMVRVASIKEQIIAGYSIEDDSGYFPDEVFDKISGNVSKLLKRQHEIMEECDIELEKKGIRILRREDFNRETIEELKEYFNTSVFPVLTPMAVDFGRPFPFVSNKSLNIVSKLSIDENLKLAIVEVPDVLDRFIRLESAKEPTYVLLEDVIVQFMDDLYIGQKVLGSSIFRVTRDADLNLMEDDADDLLMVIEKAVKKRRWGDAIRLEIEEGTDEWIESELEKAFEIGSNQVYRICGMLNPAGWFSFKPPKRMKGLKSKAYIPRTLPFMNSKNVFKTIRDGDVFIHNPYDSFDFVVDFIKKASMDSSVLAIKQTLYRVSGDSEIIKALEDAAGSGKQVTALVELMARFDEENNINWAKRLEKKGVHVIYGIYGLKTHSKITLVVRRENKKIKRYVHLGTGNYNDVTAKLYTDMHYLTCREDIGTDATIFFNMVSGFSNKMTTQHLSVSPYTLREDFYKLIDREIKHVKDGNKGFIIAKMNSLVDRGIVDKLYQASSAGVEIKLIVRGICTLVPGVAGMSENISVKSIIGEFLEHSRIYYFYNNHHPKTYLSSADWMTRNLNRRIELMFPIEDKKIANRINLILDLYIKDNMRSWKLMGDGEYKKIRKSKKHSICAHETLKNLLYENNDEFVKSLKGSMFKK